MERISLIIVIIIILFLFLIIIILIIAYFEKRVDCPLCPPPPVCPQCPVPVVPVPVPVPTPTDTTVSFMTYNILTQNIDVLPSTPNCVKWINRRDKVVQIINLVNADVFTLQEVNDVSYSYLSQNLPNYDSVQGVFRGPREINNESVAIFYRKNFFDSVNIDSGRWIQNAVCMGEGSQKESSFPRTWTGGQFVYKGRNFYFLGLHMPVKECINVQMDIYNQLVAKINSLSNTNVIVAADWNKGSGSFDVFQQGRISSILPYNTSLTEATHAASETCGFLNKGGNLDVIASKTPLFNERVWYFDAAAGGNGSDHYPVSANVNL